MANTYQGKVTEVADQMLKSGNPDVIAFLLDKHQQACGGSPASSTAFLTNNTPTSQASTTGLNR